MDRREFFRRGIGKVTEKVFDNVSENLQVRALRWVRPPFAINELDFLLVCTRCLACVEACPHKVIFPLAARNGADVMQTPALDLLNRACHLCDNWPCVNICEPKALTLPTLKPDEECLPFLATAIINVEACIAYLGPECGACAGSCKVQGALQWNNEKPIINSDKCTGCAMCREQCITDPKSITIMKT